MYPRDATGVRDARDTGDDIALDKPYQIGEKIWMFDPNMNKFLAWVLRNQAPVDGDKSVYNHIFYHLEDAPWANWVKFVGTTETSQGVTGLVMASGHGARLTLGSRLYFPRTRQIIRLTAVMSTDTTGAVTRNFGRGVATDYLRKGDYGLIMAPSFEQGYTSPTGFSTGRQSKVFYTSIVDWPVEVTGTEYTEKMRGGNPFKRELRKAVKASKDQMEAELMIAGKVTTSGTSHPLTASEGMDHFITSNVYNITKISRMDLWDIIGEWGQEGAIVCGKSFRSMVTMWSMGQMIMDQDSKKDGMSIQNVLTPFGEFPLIEVDLLNQEPNMIGSVFFVPKRHIAYRPLVFDGNRDVKYEPIDVQGSQGIDKIKGHVWGEYGWEFFQEEMFAKIYGLQFS